MRATHLSLPLALLALACAAPAGPDGRWRSEWNARADAATGMQDNPCGDFVFDAWADDFLAECTAPPPELAKECAQREEWVWARSRQCGKWQDWLLRNTNQHERNDQIPEPETRVR